MDVSKGARRRLTVPSKARVAPTQPRSTTSVVLSQNSTARSSDNRAVKSLRADIQLPPWPSSRTLPSSRALLSSRILPASRLTTVSRGEISVAGSKPKNSAPTATASTSVVSSGDPQQRAAHNKPKTPARGLVAIPIPSKPKPTTRVTLCRSERLSARLLNTSPFIPSPKGACVVSHKSAVCSHKSPVRHPCELFQSDSFENRYICPICYEDVVKMMKLTIATWCGHVFCQDCLTNRGIKWCPLCN